MENSKYKQIEEIARAMCFRKDHCTVTSCVKVNCETTWLAEALYNAGYRKASEIFEEIERLLSANMSGEFRGNSVEWFDYFDLHLAEDIAELKKKYESEKDNG